MLFRSEVHVAAARVDISLEVPGDSGSEVATQREGKEECFRPGFQVVTMTERVGFCVVTITDHCLRQVGIGFGK